MSHLYEDLLNRPPTSTELAADAGLMKEIQAGDAAARLTIAENVVSGAEFRADEVTSFFANYMHPTCSELAAEECTSTIGTPSNAELSAALAAFSGGQTEEDIIAGVLGSEPVLRRSGEHADGIDQRRIPGSSRTATDQRRGVGGAQHVHQRSDRPYQLCHGNGDVAPVSGPRCVAGLPAARAEGADRIGAERRPGVLSGDIKSLQTPDDVLLEVDRIDAGVLRGHRWHRFAFAVHTIATLLMPPVRPRRNSAFLTFRSRTMRHGRPSVTRSLVDSNEYRTDFVLGVYAKFLTYSLCAVPLPQSTAPPEIPASSKGSGRLVRPRHLRRRGADGGRRRRVLHHRAPPFLSPLSRRGATPPPGVIGACCPVTVL